MKRFIRGYAIAVGLFLLVIVGSMITTLTLASAVGYLPYSDRPGPGWYGPSISSPGLGARPGNGICDVG